MIENVELFNIAEFETLRYHNDRLLDGDPNFQYNAEEEPIWKFGIELAKQPSFWLLFIAKKKMIESFIEYKANVHVKDNMGNNGLHYIALPEINDHFEHIDEIPEILKGAFPEVPPEKRFNFNDTYTILEILLNAGVDVNLMNNRGETPLMWAARGKHMKIVKSLLQAGANVHLRNHNMQTCLHVALNYDNPEDPLGVREWKDVNYAIVLELIRNGACVNCFDNTVGCEPALYCLFHFVCVIKPHFPHEVIKVAALVNWEKKTDFYINGFLVLGDYREQRPDLISCADDCYDEIHRMRVHELPGGTNLCLFARRGVSEDEKSNENQINEQVLEISRLENFPIYHDFILGSFNTSFLRRKACETGLYTIRKKLDITEKISLRYEEISLISSYLENGDLFNLISVFHQNATI